MPATIEVIAGPMFGGKTKELKRRIERCEIAHQHVLVIKPILDTRIDRSLLEAIPISSESELFSLLEKRRPNILALDEAQFFGDWIVEALMTIRDKVDGPPLRIIVAGLDMDYRRRPFGPMPQLMAIADAGVEKLAGVCTKCWNQHAAYTQAIHPMTSQILVGNTAEYTVHCLKCHTIL